MANTYERVLVELRKLKEPFHQQALDCIRKTVKISNSPDYPASIIEYQLDNHYTLEWLRWRMKSSYFIVYLLDDKVVGTGILDDSEVKAVFVDPEYQRKGIGRDIMNKLEEFAVRQNLSEIHLNSSITGFEFYKSLHYNFIEETVTDFQGDKIITYFMKKRL